MKPTDFTSDNIPSTLDCPECEQEFDTTDMEVNCIDCNENGSESIWEIVCPHCGRKITFGAIIPF